MNKVLSQAIKKAVSEYNPTKIDTNKEKRLLIRNRIAKKGNK